MALHDPLSAPSERALGTTDAGFAALVLPHPDRPDNSARKVAGITIAERQRRQVELLGGRLAEWAERPHGGLLLIEAGLVADERTINALLAMADQQGPEARAIVAVGSDGDAGGLAWLPASWLGRDVPDWRALAAGGAERFELSAIDTYAPERRRRVPIVWERPTDPASARQAGAKLLAAAQKGCLDWPARFIHPPIENALVRLLLPSPITPNMISLLAFLIGLYAAWCFASGNLWTGLILALLVGPIDGVDGKLARTRIEYSRWGDIEHVGDKIVEYLWIAGLSFAVGAAWAYALAALIVIVALAEAVQGEFYRRMTGAQLDDSGEIERGYRLVSGRRNTFFWCLLPFAWFGRWDLGLAMIAAYATFNFCFMQWRFYVRLADYGRASSGTIAANLDATAYGFLAPAETAESEARPATGAAVSREAVLREAPNA